VKHLPKHLRPRWRYLAVEIEAWPDADLDRGSFQRALWYAAGNLLGDPGSAACDLSVYGFDFADGFGEAVVRVRHGHVAEARAALACVEAVDGDPVGVSVAGVSGTVRACEESYLGGAGRPVEQRDVAFDGSESTALVRGDALAVGTAAGYVGATALDFE